MSTGAENRPKAMTMSKRLPPAATSPIPIGFASEGVAAIIGLTTGGAVTKKSCPAGTGIVPSWRTTCPILLDLVSANHLLPSGPVVIPPGLLFVEGILKKVMLPPVVIRPILLVFATVNQRLPSVPVLMTRGAFPGVGIRNSVIAPVFVILPILFASD